MILSEGAIAGFDQRLAKCGVADPGDGLRSVTFDNSFKIIPQLSNAEMLNCDKVQRKNKVMESQSTRNEPSTSI